MSSGAIPRSLMTAGELIEADLDEQREDDAYVPTVAGLAYLPPERVQQIYAARARRETRRERIFLGCCVAATLAWIAALTITVCFMLGEVPA